MQLQTQRSPFEFTAGNLCLDFINTVNGRVRDEAEDLLLDYTSLLAWSAEAGIVTTSQAEGLHASAAQNLPEAQSVLHRAIEFREALYAVVRATLEGDPVPIAELAVVNKAIQSAGEQAEIQYKDGKFDWEFVASGPGLDVILWPVLRATAQLLTSDELRLVRECASDTCAWIFVDHTKNHKRKWCEMKTCGNRDKAKRYYARHKSSTGSRSAKRT